MDFKKLIFREDEVRFCVRRSLLLTWCSRTVSASVYNVFVQAGAIIYNNIYREDDKPLYKRGNRDLIAINCMNLVIYIGVHFFYKVLNNRRDKIWNSWTLEQRQQYLETTKDTGNKRMDFRFAY